MPPHLLRAALLAALATSPALTPRAQAQALEAPVCASRENAQMLMQSGPGAAMPEGCRIAIVRRLDTPAGALCHIDISPRSGVVGAMRDAVTTTEWWTACANLRAP